MKFKKMHGLGNDFVIFDAREQDVILGPEDMALVADRHWGVGCDLITIIDKPENACDVAAYFFNADGSESAACGNASRCVADIVMRELQISSCKIQVMDRVLACRKVGDLIEVDMGAPKGVKDMDLSYGGVSKPVAVDMGNPHLVFFVEDIEAVDVEAVGAYFEMHEAFPSRTNVEFVQVMDRAHLRQRTWERGVGVTQACGSGACAVAVAAVHRGLAERAVEIELDGGVLNLVWKEGGTVLMTGPVAYVFDGELAG